MKAPGKVVWLFLLVLLAGCRPPPASTAPASLAPMLTVAGQRRYAVHQRISLANTGPGQPEKQNIWVALIRDFPPYQSVQSVDVWPGDYKKVTDELGNTYAEFDVSSQPAGTTREIRISYQIQVNEVTYDLSSCEGRLPGEFTQPEIHIESANPQIVALAKDLARGKKTACDQARAFYEYIGSQMIYTSNGENWGAQAALGPMGSDCTEYASLLAALSRAQGIPARYFEGLLYSSDGGKQAATEHAWADAYFPTTGWAAIDPTLGQPPAKRDDYFAHYTPDHIIVTLGASPSVLRGSSYWTHLYWPGNSARITVTGAWQIELLESR